MAAATNKSKLVSTLMYIHKRHIMHQKFLKHTVTCGNTPLRKRTLTVTFDWEAVLIKICSARVHTATPSLLFHNKIKLILMQ